MYNIEEIILGMANIVNEKKKLEETVSDLQNQVYLLECQINDLTKQKQPENTTKTDVTMSMYDNCNAPDGYIVKDANVYITEIQSSVKNKLKNVKNLTLIVKEFDNNIIQVINYCYENNINLSITNGDGVTVKWWM